MINDKIEYQSSIAFKRHKMIIINVLNLILISHIHIYLILTFKKFKKIELKYFILPKCLKMNNLRIKSIKNMNYL